MTVDGVDTINMATFDFHNLLGRHEVQVRMGTLCGNAHCQYISPPPPLPSPPPPLPPPLPLYSLRLRSLSISTV